MSTVERRYSFCGGRSESHAWGVTKQLRHRMPRMDRRKRGRLGTRSEFPPNLQEDANITIQNTLRGGGDRKRPDPERDKKGSTKFGRGQKEKSRGELEAPALRKAKKILFDPRNDPGKWRIRKDMVKGEKSFSSTRQQKKGRSQKLSVRCRDEIISILPNVR